MSALGDVINKKAKKAHIFEKGGMSGKGEYVYHGVEKKDAPKEPDKEYIRPNHYRQRINESGKDEPVKYREKQDTPVSEKFPNDMPTEDIINSSSTPATGNPFFNQKIASQFGMGEQYEMYKPIIDKVADIISVEAVNRNLSPDNVKRNYIQRKQRIYQMG